MSYSAFVQARDFLQAHRTDYETAYREFKWPELNEFNWALDYFDVMAANNDRLALWVVNEDGSEQKMTYAQMSKRSNQVANWLRGLGVKRGDRILMMLGNEVPLWDTMLASIKLGAVLTPATTLLAPDDLRDRLDRGQVRHVIIGHVHAEKFADLPGDYSRVTVGGAVPGWQQLEKAYLEAEEFQPDGVTLATDPQLLYFTSGTTSKPKLVLHSQQSYPVGHLSTMYWLGLQPGDVHWNISSPGWAKHAWSCFFAPWNAGATIFIYNYNRFTGAAILETLVRCQVTTLCAPPTVWRMLIQEDLGKYPVKLRELIGAGEPLNPEVIDQVKNAWGITLRDGFGQTETTAQVGNSPGQAVKLGSMGRPMPGYQVRLVDIDGNVTDEGEICLDLSTRPTGLMIAYADDPEKTDEVMRDGFYHTGDTASVDADGYITYVGRADDVFKASDYRISPFELESVLIEHEAVAEAAVVPSPDPLRLAVPKAFLTLRAGYEPGPELARDIFVFLRGHLSPYKRIRRLEFAELPKTISGKIRRVELRKGEQDKGSNRGSLEFYEDDFQY
ncbi:MAG TPA: AMP-binding protein [Accumulibacter sp.]|nr:AMP-binding protein [Accumulibacter sp.]HMW16729.1 AMP-binding protein [Accumulibacter sp.]HMX21535.1 AMP-binding protein [Accumulibacter sp.]HMY06614.1 AMP-binding protein [Accumulibacter sp.]HNC19163.1 AMP-binding protein [Accumulibacter sp.]